MRCVRCPSEPCPDGPLPCGVRNAAIPSIAQCGRGCLLLSRRRWDAGMHVGFQRRNVLDSCKGIAPGESPGIRVCSERAQLAKHRLLLRGEGVVDARGTPPDCLCIDSETPLPRRASIIFQLAGQRVGKGVACHREPDPAASPLTYKYRTEARSVPQIGRMGDGEADRDRRGHAGSYLAPGAPWCRRERRRCLAR
jgi:hypothetical protein